jgi:hypothetical protein
LMGVWAHVKRCCWGGARACDGIPFRLDMALPYAPCLRPQRPRTHAARRRPPPVRPARPGRAQRYAPRPAKARARTRPTWRPPAHVDLFEAAPRRVHALRRREPAPPPVGVGREQLRVPDLRREPAAERVGLAGDGPLGLGAPGGVGEQLPEAVDEADQGEPLLIGEGEAAELRHLGG